MTEQGENLANIAKGILEAAPVYQDAIQPLAKEIGKAGETVGQAINRCLFPLQACIWGMDRIAEWVKRSVGEKLESVPPERIATPSAHVAGPVIEAMRFVGDQPALRDMYATLLATSMDMGTAKNAHPAFAEVIRQLTPDEARLVNLFSEWDQWPIMTVIARAVKEDSYRVVLRNSTCLPDNRKCEFAELIPTYLDNLCRLGLVEIPRGLEMVGVVSDALYENCRKDPVVLSARQRADQIEGYRAEVVRGVARRTDFGEQFCLACVLQHDRQTSA